MIPRKLIHASLLFVVFGLPIATPVAHTETYPTKPLRMVVPFPPGGGTDSTARVVANVLSAGLGERVIVDNRPGATGRIGTEIVANSTPDGYTLLMGSAGPNAILPAAGAKLPYDPIKDFTPVSLIAMSDYILVVHPSLPVKTVKDLIALARSKRGQLNYASAGNMSVANLSGELFKQLAKVDMVHVPYKGGGPAIAALLAGEVPIYFSSGPSVAPHARSGRVRLIATTGTRRSKTFPDLPTIGETLPGYAVSQWFGILVPAGTPRDIVSKLNQLIVKATSDAKVTRQIEALGSTPISNSPQEFASFIKSQMGRWAKVTKAAGMVVN